MMKRASKVLSGMICLAAFTVRPALGEDPFFVRVHPAPGAAKATITATGTGRPPSSPRSQAQARLMARRAAVVGAYRNLAHAIGRVDRHIAGRREYVGVKGYVRGASIDEVRYFKNGEVEADASITVPWRAGLGSDEGRARRVSVCEVEECPKQITEEEWMAMIGENETKEEVER